ncbi:hypothetical protein E2562_029437 [Oryza meyeriana var. granulata]|uniref:Uncharacterized protein n=1 Tax=Oryza meyeriana var. granulata TaxID=110450 RepID=A0A6G1C2F0_9ORYZ|nr:hypothetical protein E2562_029437 [Oryza meyeriana var. granulata]
MGNRRCPREEVMGNWRRPPPAAAKRKEAMGNQRAHRPLPAAAKREEAMGNRRRPPPATTRREEAMGNQHRPRDENSARLRELGIPDLAYEFAIRNPITADKNKRNYSSKDIDSDYDPSQDDTAEGDLFDDDSAKGSKDPKKRVADMPPGGIKPRYKRVYAEPQPTRITRSQKTTATSSLTPSDTNVHTLSLHEVAQVVVVGNANGHTQATVEG